MSGDAENPAEPGRGGDQPAHPDPRKSSAITAGELALVCARYDIGDVNRVLRLRRGSRSSPKIVLETTTGAFMLKRRAPGNDDPRRVAFSHDLQLFLRSRGFPAPELIGTRVGNNSMLQFRDRTYEMFRYVQGRHDGRSPEDAAEAGRMLARLHTALAEYTPSSSWTPPAGTYHDSAFIATALTRIRRMFPDSDRRELTMGLNASYDQAATAARAYAARGPWRPAPIVHGDWHPGNLLFASQPGVEKSPSRVVAVLDFDAARPGDRVIDVANGALQFSIELFSEAPSRPPGDAKGEAGPRAAGATPGAAHAKHSSHLHRTKHVLSTDDMQLTRFRSFLSGYHECAGTPLTAAEAASTPWLMIEALIAESVAPIALTGRFGRLDPMGLLRVVRRKAGWIAGNAERLQAGAST